MPPGPRLPRWPLGILFLASCGPLGRMPPELVQMGYERAAEAGDLIPLEDKASEFLERIATHHVTREGLLSFRVPWPYAGVVPPARHADTGAWTSLWAAALAYEVRVSGNPRARAELERALRGLSHLARVSGEPGLLARTLVPRDDLPPDSHAVRVWKPGRGSHAGLDYTHYLWKTDNAKAQLLCWLYAVHLGLGQIGEGALRDDLIEDLRQVTYRIFKGGLAMTTEEGEAERFGDLHPAFKPPMTHAASCCWTLGPDIWPFWDLAIAPNALVSLSLARIHDAHVPGKLRSRPLTGEGFDEIVAEGFYEVPGFPRYGNDNLSMLGILALLESHPPRHLNDALEQGAARVWRRHRHDRNTLFTLIALRAGAVPRSQWQRRLIEARYSLEVYPRDRRIRETDIRHLPGVTRKTFDRGEAAHAVPLNLLPSSSFIWKSSPSDLTGYPGASGDTVHAPMDYLLAYGLYRDMARSGEFRSLLK